VSETRKEPKQIKFRVSESEFDRLSAIAESHQMSLPALAKKKAMGYHMPQLKIDKAGAIEIAKELRAIGNNVNQLTKRANATNDVINDEELQDIQKELRAIWQQFSEALQNRAAD